MAELLFPGLWRLDVPLEGNPLKNLNSYLILGRRSLLIDTGFRWPSCRQALEAQLEEIGVDRDRLDIFVTHLHSDHAGLAPEIVRPGCTVFISSIDGPMVEAGLHAGSWRESYRNYLENGFTQEEIDWLWGRAPSQSGAPVEWKQVRHLEDGDELHYGDHTLRCILTPGHTPGHMCLYDPEHQWLFSGDHVLFQISPNICRWSNRADSLGDYLDSLARIRDLPVQRLFPAHRAVEGALEARVDELLRHHSFRIRNTWDVVQQEPGLNSYQIAGRMRWRIRSKSWEDFPLTQKLFAVGETLAHLDYLAVRGQVTCRKQEGQYVYFAAQAPDTQE